MTTENVFKNEKLVRLKNNKARIDKYQHDFNIICDEENLGWCIRPGFIVLDFDVQDYADIMEKIVSDLNLKTICIYTDRGKHFIFKASSPEFKDWTHKYNFIGLECDAKGNGLSQQKSNYECIKLNGTFREQKSYGNINILDDVETIPRWLQVNPSGVNLRLSEGEGRNSTLYSYQINLIKNKFSIENARKITKEIINKYVLKDMMSDVEIDTICRDEAYEKIKKDSKKLDLDNLIGDIRDTDAIYVHFGKLIWYINNEYTMDEDLMHNRLIEITFGHNTLESTRREIMLRLRRLVDNISLSPNHIIMDDGKLYNVYTGEILENTDEIKAVYKYRYNYDEDAKGGNVEDFINFLSTDRNKEYHEDVKQQIFEMVGCAIAPNVIFQKAFFLKGDGANGKSVLLKLIQQLVGVYCTDVNLKEFKNIFSLETLVRGTCNIVDDLGNQRLEDTDIFKQVVGGGTVTVQAKNRDPYQTKSVSTLIIAANDYPKLGESSLAIERRLVFIELNNVVEKINLNLINELCDNKEGMTWLFTNSLRAYKEAYNRGHLTITNNYMQIMAAYKVLNDNVLEFLIETFMDKSLLKFSDDGEITNSNYEDIDVDGKSFNELYELYKLWCFDKGLKLPVSNITFSKKLRYYLGKYYYIRHTKVNGTQGRYLTKKEN